MSNTAHDIIQCAVPKASYALLEFHEGLLSDYSMVWSVLYMDSTSMPFCPRTYSQPTEGRKQYTQQASNTATHLGSNSDTSKLHTFTLTTSATKANELYGAVQQTRIDSQGCQKATRLQPFR